MTRPETCSRCGEEVRRGWRHGREAYWHRLDVDHEPVFGRMMTEADKAEIERQANLPRTRVVTRSKKVKGEKVTWDETETYTAAELDLERYRKSKNHQKMEAAAEALAALEPVDNDEDDEEEGLDEMPPVEVYSTPSPLVGALEIDGRQVKVPGGCRTIINLAAKVGWEIHALTYSRGPYVGSSGKALSVSDMHRLVVRGPSVDGVRRLGVAWWRDGKADWAWRIEDNTITRGGVKTLSDWMKEAPDGQDRPE